MNFNFLIFVFPLVITLHNLEEALWLPEWSKSAGGFHHTVEPDEFRFAVMVLTLLAYAVSIMAFFGGRDSLGVYLVTGYALTMLLNVVFPHLIACAALKKYAPGTATALLLNLPVTTLLLYRAFIEQYITIEKFIWRGPLTVLCILGSIPILFAFGRYIIKVFGNE